MKVFSPPLLLLVLFAAAPAHATGGFLCTTASGPPTRISLVVGHGEAIGILTARRWSGGRWIDAPLAQSWISGQELKFDLSDEQRNRRLARVEVRRVGHVYDGTIVEGGKARWIRCRED